MLKKFFLFFTIAIALLLFTNFSFATDDFNEFNNVTNLFHINDYEKIAEFLIDYIKKSY